MLDAKLSSVEYRLSSEECAVVGKIVCRATAISLRTLRVGSRSRGMIALLDWLPVTTSALIGLQTYSSLPRSRKAGRSSSA